MKDTIKIAFFVLIIFILHSCSKEENNDVYTPVIEYPVAEFKEKLSELKIFKGALADLTPTETVETYELNTPLFTDYAKKLRFISIPEGATMTYNGEGLPVFPDNTIITKTFYYYNDETDTTQGKQILETRVLMLKNGVWNIGNYVWNDEQTEAFLDESSYTKSITWTDSQGVETTFDYIIPSYLDCVNCHQNDGIRTPLGPKIRNLNRSYNGINQIQHFIDKNLIENTPELSEIATLPNWKDDNNYNLEQRARAYMDVNCAHCHQPGGYYNLNFAANFELRYETSFEDSNIYSKRNIIITRINSDIPGFRMPFIGTSLFHIEGIQLLEEYLNSL